MPGSRLNLRQDPFMDQSYPAGAGPSLNRGPNAVNLGQDPFMYNASQSGTIGRKGEGGTKFLEVTIRMAENLPPLPKGAKKAFPVCVCQVKDKPRARLQTGACTNLNMTDPVWGKQPNYFKGLLQGWEEGDTLTFTIQDEDATSSRIIGMADLDFKNYKGGYEWWLKLDVAKMKRYPEGWPYAAVQIKLELVEGFNTSSDPFMESVSWKEEHKCLPTCYNWCNNKCFNHCCNFCCFNCRMECCRRINVCCLCTWVNTKWACIMSCLCFSFAGLECCKLWSMVWSWCMGKESLMDLRRDCAKRFKLSDADEDGDEAGDTACCCVPLRTAVFAISVLSTVNAVVAFFFPKLLNSDGQSSMGYSMIGNALVGATQITGVFFGPIGAIGASELNVSMLSVYNYYQLLRLSAMFFMIYTDIPLLYDCMLWKTDINAAIAKHGWNPAMYNVAMSNECLQSQIDFGVVSVLTLTIYVYLISLTRRLIWDTEQTPRYLLAMPRDTPNGAFVNHSRTQGKPHPPYGAILGADAPGLQKGMLERNGPQGLVGAPVQAPGQMPGMNRPMPSDFKY